MTGAKARIPPAFAAVEIGDRRKWVCAGPIGGPVSNLEFPISGICRVLCRYRFAIREDLFVLLHLRAHRSNASLCLRGALRPPPRSSICFAAQHLM
jgi:hypothetical protein